MRYELIQDAEDISIVLISVATLCTMNDLATAALADAGIRLTPGEARKREVMIRLRDRIFDGAGYTPEQKHAFLLEVASNVGRSVAMTATYLDKEAERMKNRDRGKEDVH